MLVAHIETRKAVNVGGDDDDDYGACHLVGSFYYCWGRSLPVFWFHFLLLGGIVFHVSSPLTRVSFVLPRYGTKGAPHGRLACTLFTALKPVGRSLATPPCLPLVTDGGNRQVQSRGRLTSFGVVRFIHKRKHIAIAATNSTTTTTSPLVAEWRNSHQPCEPCRRTIARSTLLRLHCRRRHPSASYEPRQRRLHWNKDR